ncbi:MAG: hypothetical protein JNJ78_09575 [Anaerolineae bacterium]|nr:hypothetical protein [Anaerolineae bacterium]
MAGAVRSTANHFERMLLFSTFFAPFLNLIAKERIFVLTMFGTRPIFARHHQSPLLKAIFKQLALV